jgi:hypothetical protein
MGMRYAMMQKLFCWGGDYLERNGVSSFFMLKMN